MSPSPAEARAAYSHQLERANNAQVAITNPRIVKRQSTIVRFHRNPEVLTPLVANVGVSQSQLLPAIRRAIPPKVRSVNIFPASSSNKAKNSLRREVGPKAPTAAWKRLVQCGSWAVMRQ